MRNFAPAILIAALAATVAARADQIGSFTAPLLASLGGTGVASPTAHTVPINQGASAQTNSGAGTNGQLIVAATSADPIWATVTAGSGISLSTGAGSLSVTNTGVSSWVATANQVTTGGSFALTNPLLLTGPGTFGATPATGSNASGNNTTFQPVPGCGNAQDEGSVQVQTPIFGASSSTVSAQNDRLYVCGKTFAGSTTSATADNFCTASLATSGTAATYYVWLHTEVKDASSPINTDDNSGVYMVTVKNKNGTLTVGTVTTITTGSAVNDSGVLTIGALTATASSTTITFTTAPSWTTIVASQVILQYTVMLHGGPTTLSPQ